MPALLLALALCQDIETQNITLRSGNEDVGAFLAKPRGDGPFPAVIVIQEWWGLNEQIKGVAKKLAREGYVALAPDLYRGKVTSDPDEAHELMRGLPEDRALSDLKAAFQFLKGHTAVKGKKIGSAGFCMGGSYSLSLAVEEPELAACVVYYGRLLTDRDRLGRIRAPLLGHFGATDRGIPVENVKQFEAALKELKKNVTVYVYEGAGHAFANETGKQYHKESAELAWGRTLEFLKRHLER